MLHKNISLREKCGEMKEDNVGGTPSKPQIITQISRTQKVKSQSNQVTNEQIKSNNNLAVEQYNLRF